MKKKTFSLSVSGEMGAGKDRPPALPILEGNHEQILTEIMERMERMEATNRKIKLLTDIEERVAKLEEAAANAAAGSSMSEKDSELMVHWMGSKAADAFGSWLQAYPNEALRMIMQQREWFLEHGCTKDYNRLLSAMEPTPAEIGL